MTKYEIEVLKKWLNEAMRQLDAEVPGQTIIPGYADTDGSKVYLSEEGYVTYKVSTYGRNRGYIWNLILTGMMRAGAVVIDHPDDMEVQKHYINGLADLTLKELDNIFRGE